MNIDFTFKSYKKLNLKEKLELKNAKKDKSKWVNI